jgi:tetratricopeptide (TPR) repeat protein
MEPVNIYILSVYLKKWSYGENKLTINFSYCTDSQYERGQVSLKIASPHNLANELMNFVFTEAREKFNGDNDENNVNVVLVNESEVLQKLTGFFSKINREYNNNKRSSGKSRMITSRSLDFYYNEYEYIPLDDTIKFFVHLNRGVNKINGDFWSNAIEDLKLALEIKAEHPLVNKYLAKAFTKLKKYEIALKYLEKSVEFDNNVENLCALANAYIKIGKYKEAEDVLKRIDELDPDSLYSKFTKALLAYKQGKGYKSKLDKLYKSDPEWLKEKLIKDWDYKKSGNGDAEIKWNAATAARYLNIDKPYELTKKAFNNEVPCYFNSESGIIRFVKDELDEWVELMNRYELDDNKYSIHPERLDASELKKVKTKAKKSTNKKTSNKAAAKKVAAIS